MIAELYSRLKKLRVNIQLVDDRLDLQAPKGVLNSELLNEIRHHKQELIALIDFYKKSKKDYISIEKAPIQDSYVLASSQRRLWLLSQFEERNVAYNMPGVYVFEGDLDSNSLAAAFNSLLERHEILRTVFREEEDENVRQVIQPVSASSFYIGYHDLRENPEQRGYVERLVQEDFRKPFDLSNGPLLRATLYRLADNTWVFTYIMHHIISDGWSMGVLMRDLQMFYNAHCKGNRPLLSPLSIQYKDYAAWQQSRLSGSDLQLHKSYWLQQFEGILPVLQLPVDKTRPAIKTYNGGSIHKEIDSRLCQEIKSLSQQHGSTLFMGLLATVTTLLHRYSHQEDIIIGCPIAGRDHADLEEQIGLYLNTLALRMQFSAQDSFESLLNKVREITLGAYEHQVYPFDDLVDELSLPRDLSRNVLFDVMVVLQNNEFNNNDTAVGLDGVNVRPYEGVENTTSKFDLLFEFTETEAGLHTTIEYNSDIYAQSTVARMADHLQQLLASVIKAPSRPLKEINYLSAPERQQLLLSFNATQADYPSGETILDLLSGQLHRTPDATALLFEDRSLSYRELHERSNQLGTYLRSRYQIEPGDLIGIKLPRNEWLVVALLAVLKSGGAYVPIDPAYPRERIDYMLSDSNCKLLLDEHELSAFKTEQHQYSVAEVGNFSGCQDLAYVIYTSGSTGLPKGVMITHSNVYSFIRWSEKEFRSSDFEVLFSATSICFDLSVYEIFYTLSAGKTIRLLPDALCIASYLTTHKKILLNTVPGVVGNLLKEGADLSSVSVLNMAGEAIPVTYLETLDLQRIEIRNLYGPSEDTTYSTCYRVKKPYPVLIGRPIDNTQIYILSPFDALVPIGVTGEICISGSGIARGYLNRPELTSEKFVENPFRAGERMYRTGDLGRWLPDGNIEFLGRKDDQVKIRGYRIELGEIESHLRLYPAVTGAIVMAQTTEAGDKDLIAYIESAEALHASDIRSYLGQHLPSYLVPGHYVQLETFPLTTNGKVDKKRLQAAGGAGISTGVEYVAPRNETEEQLVLIWQDLLGKEKIGVKDNFFDLGGHSLKATRLVSQLNKKFNAKVGITDIFKKQVLEDQALILDNASFASFISLSPVELQPDYPMSSGMRRLWLLSQFEEGNVAYNMPGVYVFEGDLDSNSLAVAFNSLLERHEILRTVFREEEDENVRQVIQPVSASSFCIGYHDLRENPEQRGYVERLVREDFRKPFDLSNGPLLRATLYRLADNTWVFTYIMHHIISDGWSMGVLMRDLQMFYNAHCKGNRPLLSPLSIQYKDYAAWQQSRLSGSDLQLHKSYWLQQFEGILPVLQLPVDKTRPAIKTYNGGSIHKEIDSRLCQEIKSLSQQHGSTLFMGLLATVTTLLHRYSHQEDIIIGCPIAGRDHADLEEQIGLYLNTLALRMQFSAQDSFESLLNKVREITLGAYEHQVYPFDDLVDELSLPRDLSRNVLFDVMVVLQNNEFNNNDTAVGLDGVNVRPYEGVENTTSKFDLLFEFTETEAGLHTTIEYNSDIYTQSTVARMADHLQQLLASVINAPSRPLKEINYLSAPERQQLLLSFNATQADYPSGETILDLLSGQLHRTPDATALLFEDRSLSYRELHERSNQLGTYLRSRYQIEPGDLIGIKLPRNEWLVVALLAVLKSGGAYVPIDPAYPRERIDYMLSDSNCKLLLDEHELSAFKTEQHQYSVAEVGNFSGCQDLAYVIYTSGSTGLPKGVMITHSNVYSFIRWSEKEFRSSDFEVLFSATSICFDLSVYEIFYTLSAGKTIRLLPDALCIASYLTTHKKILLNTVPGVVGNLLKEGADLSSVSVLNMAGEAIPVTYLEALDLQRIEVRNLYGPSEDTTYSTCYRVKKPYPVLIGRPIDNTQIYILSPFDALLPIGVTGEICISGSGIARGYLNRPELTSEKFVENPFRAGERMYRTGDLGRWMPDGNIECLGRKDEQVKIRGYRIELGEIESHLRLYPEVTGAIVMPQATEAGDKDLIAYVESAEALHASDIRSYLGQHLPSYLVPGHYVQLETFPLTTNGKVDKKRLQAAGGVGISSGVEYVAPRNETEEQLVLIWQDLLGKEKIGVKDNFFDLGGHSLKAMTLKNILNRECAFKLRIEDIYQYPTIETLVLNQGKNRGILILNNSNLHAKKNIFFIPPILGSAVMYKALSEKLTNFNCYGLQYMGLEKGEAAYKSIEEAAFDLSRKITDHNSTDQSIIILGYSMGAVIAFEMAKILEAQNKSLQLILVDRHVQYTSGGIFGSGLRKRDKKDLVQRYKRLVAGSNTDEKELEIFLSNNIKILNEYACHGKIKSPIHAIEAVGNKMRTNMENWKKFTDGEFKISFIKGDHWELFNEDRLSQLNQLIETHYK